jgi:hypothetical protein
MLGHRHGAAPAAAPAAARPPAGLARAAAALACSSRAPPAAASRAACTCPARLRMVVEASKPLHPICMVAFGAGSNPLAAPWHVRPERRGPALLHNEHTQQAWWSTTLLKAARAEEATRRGKKHDTASQACSSLWRAPWEVPERRQSTTKLTCWRPSKISWQNGPMWRIYEQLFV